MVSELSKKMAHEFTDFLRKKTNISSEEMRDLYFEDMAKDLSEAVMKLKAGHYVCRVTSG